MTLDYRLDIPDFFSAFFKMIYLDVDSLLSLISTLSDDGSAIKTHSNPYGSSINDVNLRFYSDMDANFGSDKGCLAFYMIIIMTKIFKLNEIVKQNTILRL